MWGGDAPTKSNCISTMCVYFRTVTCAKALCGAKKSSHVLKASGKTVDSVPVVPNFTFPKHSSFSILLAYLVPWYAGSIWFKTVRFDCLSSYLNRSHAERSKQPFAFSWLEFFARELAGLKLWYRRYRCTPPPHSKTTPPYFRGPWVGGGVSFGKD